MISVRLSKCKDNVDTRSAELRRERVSECVCSGVEKIACFFFFFFLTEIGGWKKHATSPIFFPEHTLRGRGRLF